MTLHFYTGISRNKKDRNWYFTKHGILSNILIDGSDSFKNCEFYEFICFLITLYHVKTCVSFTFSINVAKISSPSEDS